MQTAMVILPRPYEPGDEAGVLAMLHQPLAVRSAVTRVAAQKQQQRPWLFESDAMVSATNCPMRVLPWPSRM